MKQFLLVLSLAWASVGPALAQSDASDDAIRDVISAQIEAFRADDLERAFTFASPTIRDQFGTAERFGMMVRQGYPMVYRPEDLSFLGSEAAGPVTRQKVMMRDAEGALHILEYEMIHRDGGWQINGVQLLRASQVGA